MPRSTDQSEALARFERIRTGQEAPDADVLLALFDTLPAVSAERMLGDWTGEMLSRGHPAEARLQAMRWDGKRFVSMDEVYPIVSRDDNGDRVINDALGAARLREVVFRGVSTATMIYDSAPVFDHFRRLDDDLVLGVMDQKGSDTWLFFALRRLA